MQIIEKYFPDLSELQKQKFQKLDKLYRDWNSKINVISRKDLDNLYEKHILHSLSIAKVITFKPKTRIIDVGTGGGFPGIPLAILFTEVQFLLIDSVGKKIKVVENISKVLGLQNVTCRQLRFENIDEQYDFIISRAVAKLSVFVDWSKGKILRGGFNSLHNGILYLKGGDFSDELKTLKKKYSVYNLKDLFDEEFFETKKLIHISE